MIDSAPQIGAPSATRSGSRATAPAIDRAVLMSPGATTHAFDMNQRHVELQVADKLAGQGVNVTSPPSDDVPRPATTCSSCSTRTGVPSVASWIKIDPAAP